MCRHHEGSEPPASAPSSPVLRREPGWCRAGAVPGGTGDPSRAGDPPTHPESGCLRVGVAVPDTSQPSPRGSVHSLHGEVITGECPAPRSCSQGSLSAEKHAKGRVRRGAAAAPRIPCPRGPAASPATPALLVGVWIHTGAGPGLEPFPEHLWVLLGGWRGGGGVGTGEPNPPADAAWGRAAHSEPGGSQPSLLLAAGGASVGEDRETPRHLWDLFG